MAKKKKKAKKKSKTWKGCCTFGDSCKGGGGCFYFLGIIGAAVYFISNTSGFWGVVLALLKALVWPEFLIYGLLKYLGV